MSQPQQLTLDQGVIGLLNAVTVAQQRGAFNLQEASTVFSAFTVVETWQRAGGAKVVPPPVTKTGGVD